MSEVIKNRSEIVFLYDIKDANGTASSTLSCSAHS